MVWGIGLLGIMTDYQSFEALTPESKNAGLARLNLKDV
jgi:hypothetical protein